MSSPWKTIWTSPRETIASIVARNPNEGLWALAAIYGFSGLLNIFQSLLLGYKLSILPILLLAAILSPFWGYLLFSLFSWIIYITGKWIKGAASYKGVRAAYAWSSAPLLVNIPLWLFLAFLLRERLFTDLAQETFLTDSQIALIFLIFLARLVIAIWSLVLYINALAEVQQFTVLRTIGNIVLGFIAMVAALYLLVFIAYALNWVQVDHKTVFYLIDQTVRIR